MDILFSEFLDKPVWMWLFFIVIVLVLLVLDLGVLHRNVREIGVKESLGLSAFYITLGLLFGAWVWWYIGPTAGLNYVTGFVIEKSLAMDNIFVIAMIFTYFSIPRIYQHRVLFWGIIGVIILRAIMIGLGATLVSQFSWVLYIFAGFLILTGIKMWLSVDKQYEVGNSPILNFIKKRFRVTDQLHAEKFWVKQTDPKTNKLAWFMTPLFLALIMIEFVDLIFAIDSVPAIFAITTDPFIVYTSNIFAILGLRALYFVDRFHYLKYALAVLLVFIGSKIFIADGLGIAKIPPALSLSITFAILFIGIMYSLWKTKRSE
ncbi:TerC family protein [Acinetobacter sp. V89_7]|uniref:TerC family protein n=1 Tax=Acinetobacter sp. V89_7 TaxID=3044233 RepID=UPI00249E85DA|nr:TerC family protein [Acinetobacter sp. V89_7]MDI3378866.1 TerC family protein [Acinetobacter sp. V89_7]